MTQVMVTPPMLATYETEFAPLTALGIDVSFNSGSYPLQQSALATFIGDANAAIIGLDVVDEHVFPACPALEILARNGVGMDRVDIPAATRHGVYVTAPWGANSTSVAELSFGLMLAAARGIVSNHNRVQGGVWRRDTGLELAGKTLGIIGLGQIGRRVAVRALAFEMRVIAHDIAPDVSFAKAHGIELVGRDRVLAEADVLSLHVPLTDLTYHMMNRETIGQMKRGALLVNTARGPVLDPDALAEALDSGQIAGAGLDVHTREGEIDAVLAGRDNVVTTTHLGAYTTDSLLKTTQSAVNSLVQYFTGETPFGLLNPEASTYRSARTRARA